MLRQIAVRKPAEDISECDHDRSSRSQIGHELVEGRLERGACGLGQMEIDGSRCDVDVAEQDLHHARLGALLEKTCCVAVAQSVGIDWSLDAGGAGGETERAPECLLTGPAPLRSGVSQRGLRWVSHRRRSLTRIGSGSGTRRSLLPLPMIRSTPLVLSISPISTFAASPMRRPQAYMS